MKPNLFIVGAPKCGTTSLYNYLRKHPEVFMSPSKEPMYLAIADLDVFTKRKCFPYSIKEEDKYNLLFLKGKNKKIRGEASVYYLYFYPFVYKNMKKYYDGRIKSIKLIAMLRNPAERVISHFLFDMLLGKKNYTSLYEIFEKGTDYPFNLSTLRKTCKFRFDYLGLSRYHKGVKFYRRHFDDNFKVILFDDFKNDSNKTLREVYNFLKIKDVNIHITTYNRGFGPPRADLLFKYYSYLYGIWRKIRRTSSNTNKLHSLISKTLYYFIKINQPFVFKRSKGFYKQYVSHLNLLFFEEEIKRLEKVLNVNLYNLWINV